jgi:hypothetical protein
MKWLPSHASLTRGGCTDYVFLQLQFQRAIGAAKSARFSKGDVEQLISQVEPMAQYLVGSGQLDKALLEPIPD